MLAVYYACHHEYGAYMQGGEALVVFRSRRARNVWVNDGPPGIGQRGYRSAITLREAHHIWGYGRYEWEDAIRAVNRAPRTIGNGR